MTQKSIQANHYVLKGNQTEITYDETTFDGQPQLTYRVLLSPATHTFRGDQISSKGSDIGTLVTVTLEAVADGDTTLLTLVIPTINVIGTTEQAFKTIAIITTVQGNIAGPSLIHGAVQSYHVLKLKGKAQFVTS
jgi:hypothetical protein